MRALSVAICAVGVAGCALGVTDYREGDAGVGQPPDDPPGGDPGGPTVADAGPGGGGFDPGAFLPFIDPPAPHSGWTPVEQDPDRPGVEGTTCAPLANGHGIASTLFCAPAGMEEPDHAHPSPLVVVLPGYTMTIEQHRRASEWDGVAAEHGFYVLYAQVEDGIAMPALGIPEGPRAWYFYDGKRAKGQGDAGRLAALIDALIGDDGYSIDPDRVFVTGISAGAYMAVVMMADYPDRIAAGSIVSGGAYGCTAACSNNPITSGTYGTRDAPVPYLNDNMPPWDDPTRVTAADPSRWSDASVPKPRLIAFHGALDGANVPPNTDDLVSQWTQVLGIDATPDNAALGLPPHFVADPHAYQAYADAGGEIRVVAVRSSDLGHGIMVDPGGGPYQGGFDELPSKTACDPSVGPSCVNDWTNTTEFYEPYYSARFFGIVRF